MSVLTRSRTVLQELLVHQPPFAFEQVADVRVQQFRGLFEPLPKAAKQSLFRGIVLLEVFFPGVLG